MIVRSPITASTATRNLDQARARIASVRLCGPAASPLSSLKRENDQLRRYRLNLKGLSRRSVNALSSTSYQLH
jgi:hypothetical protein